MPSSSPRSCSSKRWLPQLSPIIMSGSGASPISPCWLGLQKVTSSTHGKASVITRGRAICGRSRKQCKTGAAATFLEVSRQCEDCRASAVTPPMLSRRSPSISQSRSSKPTLLAFWRVCLISTTRSIERQCVIFSAKYQQHQHAGDGRQDRDWDTKARIIPEADFQMFARRFHYDHVGDGTNDGEIASKCRRQREHFPHQDRFGKARDPFSRHKHERHVRENVRSGYGKPCEIPSLRCHA